MLTVKYLSYGWPRSEGFYSDDASPVPSPLITRLSVFLGQKEEKEENRNDRDLRMPTVDQQSPLEDH